MNEIIHILPYNTITVEVIWAIASAWEGGRLDNGVVLNLIEQIPDHANRDKVLDANAKAQFTKKNDGDAAIKTVERIQNDEIKNNALKFFGVEFAKRKDVTHVREIIRILPNSILVNAVEAIVEELKRQGLKEEAERIAKSVPPSSAQKK